MVGRTGVGVGGLVLAWVWGCAEARLDVSFVVPAQYRGSFATSVLTILEPIDNEPFGCDELRFNELDEDLLRLARVKEVVLSDDARNPLEGIDGKATKLLWARGEDSQGRVVVAGCEAVGAVEGSENVTIRGEPAALVEWANPLVNPLDPMQSFAAARLSVTDALGQPLAGVEARFTVVGPAGQSSTTTETADSHGILQPDLQGSLPELAGPVVVETHVRWEREPLPWMYGFQMPATEDWLRGGEIFSWEERALIQGPVGPSAEPGYAYPFSPQGTDFGIGRAYLHNDQLVQDAPMEIAPAGPGTPAVLLLVPEGASQELLVITDTSWLVIDPATWTADTYTYSSHGGPHVGEPPRAAFLLGSCPPGPGTAEVLVRFSWDESGSSPSHVAYGTTGGLPIVLPPLLEGCLATGFVRASGCVADEDGVEHRVLVVTEDGATTVIVVDGESVHVIEAVPHLQGAAGFSPRIGANPAQLLLPHATQDALVVSRWTLRMSPTPALTRVSSHPMVGPPASLDGGDIDGDGLLDLVAAVPSQLDQVLIQIILGAERRGTQLSSLLALQVPVTVGAAAWARDGNGDGIDDLWLATAIDPAEPWDPTFEFQVLLMGRSTN